ncbi:MAG: NAD(P)-dependent oxidoreductase [Desulfovibrio sp.]|jgi:nucleoside-diphosphate-sugar epimerase|nr:NAD(P)-dependent oxidoreductase [Desulfovibrio sp.]
MSAEHLRGKRVLVTGGTGFVGRHLLPLLLEAGARVTCLTRACSRTASLPEGVATARADLHSGAGLAQALEGQEIVIHMAALLFGFGWQDYLRANARAAAVLTDALEKAEEVKRVALISSLAAAGPCAVSPGIAEDAAPMPVSAYGWSKLLVEQTLRPLGEKLVILRPPVIYGSADKGLLPVFRGAARGVAVSPGAFREFPVSVLHVRDMARAVLRACAAETGGVYHLNDGREHTMSGFCRAMGLELHRLTGRPARGVVRVLRLPLPVMAVTAAFATGFARFASRFRSFSRAPNWNMDKYREARQPGWLADAGRIRREWGWTPVVPLADGLAEAVEGYLRGNML